MRRKKTSFLFYDLKSCRTQSLVRLFENFLFLLRDSAQKDKIRNPENLLLGTYRADTWLQIKINTRQYDRSRRECQEMIKEQAL